jgi:3-hydroxyacyl-CoA dehydrogenase/enoyl-CoA hydratase/3-hydroxybutyryl-CoA epimerase/enoyl-CoA isomerase
MEKFGWPMGPAYLLDVVGLDTAYHAESVMAEGFPERMKLPEGSLLKDFYEAKRYGQKNGLGFYQYKTDAKGRPQKSEDPAVESLIGKYKKGSKADMADTEIVERMMLAMILECSRCLEDKIVDSPEEVDMSLLYGLGFPAFRGGALLYADQVGLKNILALCEKYKSRAKLYEPTAQVKSLAANDKTFYA